MIIINQLTARQVTTVTRPGLHADGARLYLQVSQSGAKSWVFRYDLQGRTYSMGLGSTAIVTLQEARRSAHVANLKLLDGVNPLDEKRASRTARQEVEKTKTFKECAREYIIGQQAGWKNKREPLKWAQTLDDFVYPHIGRMSVRTIAITDIMNVLKPIWYTRTQTAVKVRARIERIIDWAVEHGLRAEGSNPASWKRLKHLLPAEAKVKKVVHRAALPWDEVGEFVRDLQNDTAVQCRALEFLILTATRSEETLGARWDEIDLEKKLWVIPAERMLKNNKEHRVPLSTAAVALLKNMPMVVGNPYVFIGNSSGGRLRATAMQQKIRETNDVIMVHGFRSTFRDWAGECTEASRETAEAALAHAVGNQTEAAYRRADALAKRRILMEAWGEFVTKPPAQVVLLKSAAGD